MILNKRLTGPISFPETTTNTIPKKSLTRSISFPGITETEKMDTCPT